ncbi:MAG: hypothetical protein FOGNACKC_00099 [Anaerolineae bacterium]|nr:hypothetical protein [Anaerolineae bacterium]
MPDSKIRSFAVLILFFPLLAVSNSGHPISFNPSFLAPQNYSGSFLVQQKSALSAFIRVPQDVATLQNAISQVSDGGVIEMANGTYSAPAGEGFQIKDTGKSFTIRAASGASVVLDGGGTHQIVTFINSTAASGGLVTFQGITFANGFSSTTARAGGVSIYNAQAAFEDCLFQGNIGQQPNTGFDAGAILVSNSTVSFTRCNWTNNQAKNQGAGLVVRDNTSAAIVDSSFTNNSTSIANHRPSSAGGGIMVINARLSVTGTQFTGNKAGYVGGAIYIYGDYLAPVDNPRSSVLVSDCTFSNNQAVRHASVAPFAPTEGGAVHVENQASVRIFNSVFQNNSADIGGGINAYRGTVFVDRSYFNGNRATGTGAANGQGGAFAVSSIDVSDASTNFGATNRPSASLTVQDTVIEGLAGQTVGQSGGGIYAAGDVNRVYGEGVPKSGTVSFNRAKVVVENVIFFNTDIQEASPPSGTGIGGGMSLIMADALLRNVMFLQTDAFGATAGGGALSIYDQSLVNMDNVTIAQSTAGKYGGGIVLYGSELHSTSCEIIESEISPGISEIKSESTGASIFTAIDTYRQTSVTGALSNCLLSPKYGLPIIEGDSTNGPINDLRYNQNQIYSPTFAPDVYRNDIVSGIFKSVVGLNNLIVTRVSGINTVKSQVANTALGTKPSSGKIMAVPSYFTKKPGDPPASYTYYLGYAWSGTSAKLDGSIISSKTGLVQKTDQGQVHTLTVDGTPYTDQVNIYLLDKNVYLPIILQ